MGAIANNIKKIRELRNYTQDYMATQLGMTQAGYSKIESGSSDVSFTKLEEIATILKVTPEELVAFDTQKYFNSFNNIRNTGSLIIDSQVTGIQQLYEDKIKLLEKALQASEDRLKSLTDKFGDIG